jgi:hypothetical protein
LRGGQLIGGNEAFADKNLGDCGGHGSPARCGAGVETGA